MPDRAEVRAWAGDVAKHIGRMLGQEYRQVGGAWWLFTLGKPARALTAEEVTWHTDRRHSPFVPGGLTVDDPRWFDDVPGDSGGQASKTG